MKKLITKEWTIAEHRKMWWWIAEETLKREKIVYKEEYLEEYFPDEDICCDCFCCEYDKQKTNSENDMKCKFCPLDWGSDCSTTQCVDKNYLAGEGNLFALWESTLDWKEAAELAKQIAELPERKEVE